MFGDSTQYDSLVYKVLSRNDIGKTGGHQAGPVITRDIKSYFPDVDRLPGTAPSTNLRAELFIGPSFVGLVDARYQKQTWGGTRPGEYRITRNMTAGFLNKATAGDICVFQRRIGTTDHYRLTLAQKGTAEHAAITSRSAGNAAGTAPALPAKVPDLQDEIDGLNNQALEPFTPTEPSKFSLSTVRRRLRSEAFQKVVREQYGHRCALCGGGFESPAGPQEVQAAHIVARSADGTNDPRNGLALCQSHHWAFDNHLWTVRADGQTVLVPKLVKRISSNTELVGFDGKQLRQPTDKRFAPAADALKIHRDATVGKWP